MSQGKETWNLAKANSLTQTSGVAQQAPRPLSHTAAPEASLTHQRSNTLAETLPSVALPRELPRNVQQLLRGYFEMHQTTRVPSEIYNLQVYRIFSTAEGRPAIYVAHPLGELLTVHAYRLPQMNDTKHSSRLLVAEGEPFDEPIVLARTSSHSRQYRAWKGALDDPSAPPVVLRRIVGGGNPKKIQQRSSAGTGTTIMRQPVLGKRKSFEGDSDQLDERHLEADTTKNPRLRDNPGIPSQTKRIA